MRGWKMVRGNMQLGKRGEMELWQIVLMILAILLLLAFIVWYGFLSEGASSLLQKLGNLL